MKPTKKQRRKTSYTSVENPDMEPEKIDEIDGIATYTDFVYSVTKTVLDNDTIRPLDVLTTLDYLKNKLLSDTIEELLTRLPEEETPTELDEEQGVYQVH